LGLRAPCSGADLLFRKIRLTLCQEDIRDRDAHQQDGRERLYRSRVVIEPRHRRQGTSRGTSVSESDVI
jgi:hypothetical protein